MGFKDRTIIAMARSLLKEKDLPNCFWVKAVATTVHILNISPTKVVQDITPYEAWKGVKPSVGYLKVFWFHSIFYDLFSKKTKTR